jgi:hypothetical protein
MNQSETIVKLSAALVKAQAEMSGAVKDSANPFFKSSYADLNSVIKAIKEPFAKYGLAYTQFPYTDEKGVGVVTRLIHESGEWIECGYTLPLTKLDPQAAGSAITYARRYALQAMAGIPAVDDDAEGAMNRTQKPSGGRITRTQAQTLHELLASTESDVAKFCAVFSCRDVDSMDSSYYDKAIHTLKKKQDQKNAAK